MTPSFDDIKRIGWTVTNSGCWEWNGVRIPRGYGQIAHKGKMLSVHRLVHSLKVGPIPEGHVVRHRCDNPPCMRPEHLTEGTYSDNVQDMIARGRGQHGERHYHAKISDQQISEIRTEYSKGILTQQMLADVYGVGQPHISSIVKDKMRRQSNGYC